MQKKTKLETSSVRRSRDEKFEMYQAEYDQSFVEEFPDPLNYNLKRNEFKEFDYSLENWIDRRFTFQDIKKDYNRAINGPTTTRKIKKSRQPQLEQAFDQTLIEQTFDRTRATLDPQKSLDIQNPQQKYSAFDNESVSESMIQQLERSQAEVKSYKRTFDMRQSTAVIEIADSDDMNAVQVQQDSEQLYQVRVPKKKVKTIDLQTTSKQISYVPKLDQLLLQALQYGQNKLSRRGKREDTGQAFANKKLEIPESKCIKLDDESSLRHKSREKAQKFARKMFTIPRQNYMNDDNEENEDAYDVDED